MKFAATRSVVWGTLLLTLAGPCTAYCPEGLAAPAAAVCPTPSPVRAVAIGADPPGGPPFTPDREFGAVQTAGTAGVNANQLFFKWNDLEHRPGVYALGPLQGALLFNSALLRWQLLFTLAVIDTAVRQVPADLGGVSWSDPHMMQRFHKLIDKMAPSFDSHLAYISVGNEVDIYFLSHPAEWASYKIFYRDAVSYIHSVAPAVKVGVTTTFEDTLGPAQSNVLDLISASDVVIFTYYPVDANFRALGTATPLTDFPRMVSFANGRPVILQEAGYPSVPLVSSSPQDQAAFVDNVFAAWQQQAVSNIPFLSYYDLHDYSKANCNALPAYYKVQDSSGRFRGFLCTTGLRNADGSPKRAWTAFVQGVAKLNGH